MVEISRVKAEQLYPLRLKVLRGGSENVADAAFCGDNEESSVHIALYDEVLAGGASLIESTNDFIDAEKPVRLRGLAVYEEYRGLGYARAITAYAEFCAFEEMKADVIWLYSRERAVGFYEKLGYKKTGDAFNIDGIGRHFLMSKSVKSFTPGCKCKH